MMDGSRSFEDARTGQRRIRDFGTSPSDGAQYVLPGDEKGGEAGG